MSTTKEHPNVLLLGIQTQQNKTQDINDYFEEFISLVKTSGVEYDQTHFIKLRHIDKANFLSKGKLHDLVALCDEHNIEEIICSETFTPLQERNLENLLDCRVFDREKLIIEIFRNAAHTAEGKIQVEMAELEYKKTRLAGKGVQLSQQAGYIGGRGPGETEKEFIKRHLAEKFRQAGKRLKTLQKSRDVQRKRRLESGTPLICLIGYTNAGKSSVLNVLTKSNILAEDKLFATLDTTTRELFVDSTKVGLISDTVGFISQLPHHLIEAFKSTLDELHYAHLLLQVVDISHHAWRDQVRVVHETLDELDVDKPMLYVFNKTDKLNTEQCEQIADELSNYEPHVLTHTKSKAGVAELIAFLGNYDFKK